MNGVVCTRCGRDCYHVHYCPNCDENPLDSKELDRLKNVFAWLLGVEDDFPERQDGGGLYWWREELRKKLGVSYEFDAVKDKTILKWSKD